MNNTELPSIAPEATIQNIKEKGDPIDRQILMSRINPGQLVLGFEGAALGASLTPELNYITESLMTFPGYSIAGIALAAGTYGGLRHIDQRNAARAEASQGELRAALQEPVDLITTGRGKKRELTMRWYGADETGVNTALETVARYKSIVNFAEEHGIERVAVDAQWAEKLLAKPEATDENPAVMEFGEIKEGETFVSDLKKATLTIRDTESAKDVLVSDTEQAKALIAAMELSGKELLLGELVKRSGDRDLMQEYQLFKKTEGKSHGRLLQQAHGRLELLLNQETSGVIRTRNDAWEPVRERVHRHQRIQGEYVHTTILPTTNATHSTKSSFEISGLLDRFGARTLNQLVGNVLKSSVSDSRRDETLAAIYMLALRRDKQQYDGTSAVSQKARRTLGDPETLFERLPKQPRGILGDTLHTRKVRKSEDLSLEYEKKKTWNRRVAAIATFGIATAVFGGMQIGSEKIGSTAFIERADWCDTEILMAPSSATDFGDDFNDRYQEYLDNCSEAYSKIDQTTSTIADFYITKSNAEWDLAKAATNVLMNVVGTDVVAAIAPYTVSSVSSDWQQRAMHEIPPSFYTQKVSEEFTGDAGIDTNQVVYTVDALHGDSTKGYWYGATFDEMEIMGGGNIAYREQDRSEAIAAPGQLVDLDELDEQADYKVSTPYLSVAQFSMDGINMPMLEGTELLGVRILDANDASKVAHIGDTSLEKQPANDIYSVTLSPNDLEAIRTAGIEHPVFTYWISMKPDGSTNDYYTEPMRYPLAGGVYVDEAGNVTDNYETETAAGKDMLNDRTKSALGLPEDATVEEVFEAISSKKYSYTPMADAHLDSLTYAPININDDYDTLSQISETLASMKSLNCNLAATSFLLGAVQDRPNQNLGTGFHDDGDGLLTQREAHAWVVDEYSEIHDATPSGFAENSKIPSDDIKKSEGTTTDSLLSGGLNPGIVGGLLTGIGAIIAFRKRREILHLNDTMRVKLASGDPNAQKALHVIEHALYGPKDEVIDWSTQREESISDMTRRIGSVARMTKKPTDDPRIVDALDNDSLTNEEKKAVRKLTRVAKAASRL